MISKINIKENMTLKRCFQKFNFKNPWYTRKNMILKKYDFKNMFSKMILKTGFQKWF